MTERNNMAKEIEGQQVRGAFLEAERYAVTHAGYAAALVVPSADGSNLYHMNIFGPGKGLGNVDIGVVHQVLGTMFDRLPTLTRFLEGLKKQDRILSGQHFEWRYLVTGSQKPLVLSCDLDEAGVGEPNMEFWELRRPQEQKRRVS